MSRPTKAELLAQRAAIDDGLAAMERAAHEAPTPASSMRYPRIAERLYGTPLLLVPEKAYAIERVFQSYTEAGALPLRALFDGGQRPAAQPVERKPYPMADGGIAVIDISGTLVQKSSFMDTLSGLQSYASIGAAFDYAQSDPDVRGIMLEVDSGGGEVNGCFDLADSMAASEKPVWCVVNEAGYSAAYALASAADRIILPRTAGVGSIGVMTLHVDQSASDAKKGMTYTPIFSGDHKVDGHSHAPLADDVRAKVQARLDGIYQIFVSTVAKNRGMTAEAVIATQADVFSAPDAITNGLADSIGTVSDALAAFAAFLDDPDQDGDASSDDDDDSDGMPELLDLNAAAAAQLGVEMTDTTNAANAASITPEALASAQAAARTEAAAAERARVSAIVGSEEAKGRADLANHFAFETGMSAEDAVKALAKAPKATAAVTPVPTKPAPTPFEAAMAASGNPDVRAGADATESENSEAAEIEAFAKRAAAYAHPKRAA